MRNILEQAVIAHLSGDADKSQELFHQFIVGRARQIHESLRNGETVTEGFEDEDTVNEEFFSEDDLAKLEDPVEDESEVPALDAGDEELGIEGDEEPALNGEEGFGDEELGAEVPAEEGDLEVRIEELEAELERLAAEFEALNGESGETEEFADDVADATDLDDDMTDVEGADEFADEDEFEEPVHESADEDSDDEFDDLAESVVSELEKISVKMTDGEIGDGAAVTQNNKSNLPQKKVGQRDGATPIVTKQDQHKGFERETAPGVTTLKKRKNNVDRAASALTPVAKTDKAEHKAVGAGTGKSGSITAKSPKSPVTPTKGVQK